MSRIATLFQALEREPRIALMPYLTVGFPEKHDTLELIPALEAAGADMFELGVPFSDPLADGATVQRASQRALANGVHLPFCVETVRELRVRGVRAPLLLMGYFNPFFRYGLERLCHDAAAAGADGLIVPDLPPAEAHELHAASKAAGLDLIFFVAPTSPDERIAQAGRLGSGFLYCVSLAGVTGARSQMSSDLESFLARVRRLADLPLVVGFGISTPEHVARVAQIARGAIVGSALINMIEELPPAQRVAGAAAFIAGLRSQTAVHT
jgi:tryptophan synthase alpha chain